MLSTLCEEITNQVGVYYISRILKSENSYCFYFSDKYGNSVDMMPLCINGNDKTEQAYQNNIEADGEECEVPIEYMPYKNMVVNKLQESYSQEVITKNQIVLLVNYLYYVHFMALEAHEIYSICNYFVSIVINYCNEDELNNIYLLEENPVIKSFLDMSINEKRNASKECAYRTSNYNVVCSDSEKILEYSLQKHEGKEINLHKISDIKKKIMENIGLCEKEIENSVDPILDKEYLLGKIKWLQEQILIECDYCLADGFVQSERMKELISKKEVCGKSSFTSFEPFSTKVEWNQGYKMD